MLNLGTIWDDASYGPEAPQILFDMVSRNLPEGTEGSFIAFTDFEDDLGDWIVKRPLNAQRDGTYMVPLNSVVVRALDDLLEGKQVQSCFFDGSWPSEAAVVVFPNSRPQDHLDTWVRHVYKIGGGSSAEMSYISNTSKDRLKDNIKYAFRKAKAWFEPEPAHDGTALIIGGGPSLTDDVPFVRAMSNNCTVFAVNAVPGFLSRHDVRTDIHVVLDAHPYCAKFVNSGYPVKRYYASQCDQAVLLAASETKSLVCWHGGGEAMDELAKDGFQFMNVVGGGSTAATRAMVLAYGLGYRKFHLFGMDSSHQEGLAHAYEQPFSEASLEVTCGDEVFKTSPQLLGQAEDFKMMFPDFMKAACEITVHGKGLLRALATQMAA